MVAWNPREERFKEGLVTGRESGKSQDTGRNGHGIWPLTFSYTLTPLMAITVLYLTALGWVCVCSGFPMRC